MRKTNKTLKVTRGIVLLLCCIIFFSSFSVVYALGLGKHNNIFENLNDTVAASKQDTYPYSRLTAVKSGDVVIEEALSSDKISSVGMDVLYGTTHGLVMYYGEVPYKETWSKDKRVSGWEGYAYQKDTTLSDTDYWGKTGISKDEVSVEDLENVNSTDKIVSLRLYALSKSPVAFQFWFRNIGYIIQSFFANLGTKIVSLLVAAKNIDMSDIVNALGLAELSKVVNKAFIWNSDGTGGGHLSIFTVFCLLMFIVSIVGYGISYARGTKKTKDIKDILLPAFAGIIIIGMCLTGRIETLGSSLSNAVSKVVYSIAGIATDSNGGAIFITSVDDPKYENKVVQIQEMSLINKCLIDMQICTQFDVDDINELKIDNFGTTGTNAVSDLPGQNSLNFSDQYDNNIGYYFWFADSSAKNKTDKNKTYPDTNPSVAEGRMEGLFTWMQKVYNNGDASTQEKVRNMFLSFANPHAYKGAFRMFLFFIIMIVLALCLWRYAKDILIAKLKMILALLGMAIAGPLMITGKDKLVQTGKDLLGVIIISFIEITIHSIMFDAIIFAVAIIIKPDIMRLIITIFLLLLLWHFNKALNEQIKKATANIERSVISSNGIVANAKRSASRALTENPHRWLEERARRYDEKMNADGKSNAGNLRSRMLHLAANTTASANQTQSLRKITQDMNEARKRSNLDYEQKRAKDAADATAAVEANIKRKQQALDSIISEASAEAVQRTMESRDFAEGMEKETWEAIQDTNISMNSSLSDINRIKDGNVKIGEGEDAKELSYSELAKRVRAASYQGGKYEDENHQLVELTEAEQKAYDEQNSKLTALQNNYKQEADKKAKLEADLKHHVEDRHMRAAITNADDNTITAEEKEQLLKAVDSGEDMKAATQMTAQNHYKDDFRKALEEQNKIANEQADQKLDSKKIGGHKRVNEEALDTANQTKLRLAELDNGLVVSSEAEAKAVMKEATKKTIKDNQFDLNNNSVYAGVKESEANKREQINNTKNETIEKHQDDLLIHKTVATNAAKASAGIKNAAVDVTSGVTKAGASVAATATESAKMVGNAFKKDIHAQNEENAQGIVDQVIKARKEKSYVSPDSKKYAELAAKEKAAQEAKKEAEKRSVDYQGTQAAMGDAPFKASSKPAPKAAPTSAPSAKPSKPTAAETVIGAGAAVTGAVVGTPSTAEYKAASAAVKPQNPVKPAPQLAPQPTPAPAQPIRVAPQASPAPQASRPGSQYQAAPQPTARPQVAPQPAPQPQVAPQPKVAPQPAAKPSVSDYTAAANNVQKPPVPDAIKPMDQIKREQEQRAQAASMGDAPFQTKKPTTQQMKQEAMQQEKENVFRQSNIKIGFDNTKPTTEAEARKQEAQLTKDKSDKEKGYT